MAVDITVTPEAERRFVNLAARRGVEWFRVDGEQDCDCGKVGFRVDVAEGPAPDDEVVRLNTPTPIGLVVSPAARAYVDGSTIGFSDDLMHTGFVVDNPNVQTWCGRAPRE